MKKEKCCPKCESLKIGYLSEVPDFVDSNRYSTRRLAEPRPDPKGKWQELMALSDDPSFYGIEGYICTECGYLETYAKNPADIPFERLKGFAWVNPEETREGPFR